MVPRRIVKDPLGEELVRDAPQLTGIARATETGNHVLEQRVVLVQDKAQPGKAAGPRVHRSFRRPEDPLPGPFLEDLDPVFLAKDPDPGEDPVQLLLDPRLTQPPGVRRPADVYLVGAWQLQPWRLCFRLRS